MRSLRPLALMLASALLYAYAWHGPVGWVAGWLWPLPALLAAPTGGPFREAGWAFGAWCLGALAWWPLEHSVIPLPIFALAHLAMALPFALAVFLYALCRQRRQAWAPWVFAASFTLLTALITTFSPHGTWGLLVYTQTWTPLLQALAWGGPFLLFFAMAALPAALASWRLHPGPEARRNGGVALGLFAWLLTGGLLRIQTTNITPSLSVGLMADDRVVADIGHEEADRVLPIVAGFATEATALAARGAQIIVLPEKAMSMTPSFEAEVDRRLAAAAPKAILIAGLNGMGRPLKLNVARVYAGGQPRASLLKRHLVPGWEAGYAVGPGPLTWPAADTRLGLAICKDFDFTDTSRSLSRADARLVLAPAWDFAGTEAIHAQMARFRAVEGGFALARCAQEGRLDAWDAFGRSLGSASTDGGKATLMAVLPLGPGTTPYARWGEWICVVSGVLLLLAAASWVRGPGESAT
ncbi:nitrilase-related carbon-nitrogen hydrolase [Geothrix sp. PMB-07]|uniref:nitrilase-related carbon-nitrogen hydrolase n=1 Tax=Geothrix sp. PMB-07 TaxID=3068640 RepID=UPI0027408CA4|nr:nitrilase-related carbon-nitrogen hydrolase [Geothrix sp. PMB-07]WLT32584.1 nitrilase-related carbon-nitrogen hydrolase [Geothrix sp. PMB-07]